MRILITIGVLALQVSAPSYSAKPEGLGTSAEAEIKGSDSTSSPTLETDESTFKQIFESNVAAAVESAGGGEPSIDAEAQVSYTTLDRVVLKNKYFEVPLSDGMGSIPMLHLNFAYRAFTWNGLRIDPTASVGYGYRESLVTVRSSQGLELRDMIKIHMIPISGSVRLSYRLPFLSVVRLEARPGVGVQWLNQSGVLDGIDQGFWIPYGFVSAGVNIFDQSHEANSWFGGVSLSGSRAMNLTNAQTSRLWQVDLGVRFLL